MNTRFPAQKPNVIFQPLVILAAFDERADFFIESLDAHFELKRARREPADDLAQRFGQAVRHHFKMEKMSGLIAGKKEFQNGLADVDVKVERAIHKLELLDSALEQALQFVKQAGQRNLPNR